MLVLKCKCMRWLVYASGLIFMLGIILQIVLNLFEPGNLAIPGVVSYLAFISMLLGPILLLTSVVIGLLPGEAKKMRSCEH